MKSYRDDPRDLVVARNWATGLSANAFALLAYAWIDLALRVLS